MGSTSGTKGKKILLVDDDEALRQSLGEQLRLHEEFDTHEADSGSQALSKVKGEYWMYRLFRVFSSLSWS